MRVVQANVFRSGSDTIDFDMLEASVAFELRLQHIGSLAMRSEYYSQ